MPHTRTEMISAPDGGAAEAHLTLPEAGSGPGIVLLPEIFGVNEFVIAKAASLAELGYVVLCPDVFWRVAPRHSLAHDEAGLQKGFEVVGRYQTEIDDETKSGDLVRALDHLKSLNETTGKTAAMGYCLGGVLAYLVAAAGSPDACVSYYGSAIPDLLGLAGSITCPILFHFGDSDPYLPNEGVEAIRQAFEGRDNAELLVQAGAGHAFENLFAPQFANPEAAARSWAATVEFLAVNLA
jgi:carboxymethylenebutenolidase